MHLAYTQNDRRLIVEELRASTHILDDTVFPLMLFELWYSKILSNYHATYIIWMLLMHTSNKQVAPVGQWHHLAALPVRGLYLLYLLAHGACLPMWLVVCVQTSLCWMLLLWVLVVVLSIAGNDR